MAEIGIRALKQNASEVVAQAAAGQTLTVTDRGRPVATLSPLRESPLESLLALGLARRARIAMSDLLPPVEGPPLSEDLAAARDDERY